MDDQIRIVLIIIISVSIFGLLVFVFVKNYMRNKIKSLVEEEKRKKFTLIPQLTQLKTGSKKLIFSYLSRILVYLYDHQLFHLC